jgi:SAM-dependent methyltransferase
VGKQQESSYYDKLFSDEGYAQEPEKLRWYPIWKSCAEGVTAKGANTIIDLGCGPGHLAEVIRRINGYKYQYIGYDFSRTAIDVARNRLGDPRFDFRLVDLQSHDFNENAKDDELPVYVSTEFFEHVEFDLEVVEKMKSGSSVFFSLPRFDDPGHVRFFEKDEEIRSRYETLLDIHAIKLMSDKWRYCIKSTRK